MKKILIANRGEIARRVIASAHRMGIATVAVHSHADANALHVREARQAFALGGNASADSYLRIDKLLAAARATGADAVHPGYGFLSEDAGFAQAVLDAGLVWIGPPPAAIRALGSKAAAKALAVAQGVPCLPGYAGADQSEARFVAEAGKIGYPVMVKAVAGGGGRGMRLVAEPDGLPEALRSARSEALTGFGNGELLIERAILHPRHVEVQVFADTLGHCIHLGERDCSVQRRHQKIIEEAPSPAMSPELRERMGQCAVALARGAGYVGAGTVEFLLEGQEFFLMEMNTRLQVEHPVTEAITGLDLVEWQIRIARGEALPLTQEQVEFRGHAVEVRLCAEDENHVPHAGSVVHFAAPAAASFEPAPLRFDHAIAAGGEVTPFYDAMLGKLIAHAPTRAEAIDALVGALAQTEVLGLPTNRGLLMACLDDPVFRRGEALISFLAERGDALREQLLAAQQRAHRQYAAAVVLPAGEHGLACAFDLPLRLRHREQAQALVARADARGWVIQGAPPRHVVLQALPGDAVLCTESGLSERVRAVSVSSAAGGRRWHAQAGGVDWWLEDISFQPASDAGRAQAATELRAPFSGRVVRISAQIGEPLAAGDAAVVIESMKLEHNLSAGTAAIVAEVLVAAGQQVNTGQVLLRFAMSKSGSAEP